MNDENGWPMAGARIFDRAHRGLGDTTADGEISADSCHVAPIDGTDRCESGKREDGNKSRQHVDWLLWFGGVFRLLLICS